MFATAGIKILCSPNAPKQTLLKLKKEVTKGIRLVTAANVENAQGQEIKDFKEMPGPRVVPLLGSAWVFLPLIGRYNLHKLHLAWVDKHRLYGDVIREKFGPLEFVFSFKPEHLDIVYENEGPYPSRGEFDTLKFYRESRKKWYKTNGVLATQGKEWWDLRSKTQKHLMKPKAVLAYLLPMQEVAKDFVQKIHLERDSEQEISDFLPELYKWALESIALVGLDARLGCLERNLSPDSEGMKMIRSVQAQFDLMGKLEMVPFYKYFSTPNWKRYTKASDIFSEIAFRYINNALNELKGNEQNEDKEHTLLQTLLLEKGLDLSGAMVTVADMLMAGIDTTSHTMGFLLYYLAKNQDKQEILYQEIHSLLPSKDDKITPEIFSKLRYVKACLKESQRLIPIIPGVARKLMKEAIISGYRIPAGTIVIVNNREICRQEKYFKNALAFEPERWLDRVPLVHRFSFLPFGYGTRSCMGRRIAELEIACLTTEIIRRFKVEYHHEDIDILTRLINTPDRPLKFSFINRY